MKTKQEKHLLNDGSIKRKCFLESSGLDKGDMEICGVKDEPDRISIIYRDPITHDRMTTPDGRLFRRYKMLGTVYAEGKIIKYLTCKNGGVHLYFPDSLKRGNVVDYLKDKPDSPVYFTEGEKKAAKAWKEGIPCIGLSGIWCWLANKEDRPNDEKILNPDFNLIPDFVNRTVIMVYDSDATDQAKRKDFEICSTKFEQCLRSRGVSRYEKIVLPSKDGKKIGLDDYLLKHSVREFKKLAAEQFKIVPFGKYVMTSKEFLSTNFPAIKCIVNPWLTDCGLTMVHAAAGVGKTFFLLGLSAAITRKKLPEDFCGWKIEKGAGVLFVDGEMPSTTMQSRLAKVEKAYPDTSASNKNSLSILSCMNYTQQTGKMINLSNEDCRNELTEIIVRHPAKIIILDNIVSLMTTKDENDAGAWSVINQWLVQLRFMRKSVIIVHHSSKHGGQRGTSHRTDNLDTVIKLHRRENDGVTVEFEKHRHFGVDEASPVHIDFHIDDNMAVFTRSESSDVDMAKRDKFIFKMHKKRRSYERIIKVIEKKYGQKLTKGRISQIVAEMKKKEQNAKV
jgi:hypothetical protein